MENLNIREDVSDIVNKTELLADLQIGFWIIEYPNDGIPKMYGDTIMYSLLGGNSNTLTPEERYLEIINRCPDLLKLITLKELASYLLIRPETLSRIRRKVVQK